MKQCCARDVFRAELLQQPRVLSRSDVRCRVSLESNPDTGVAGTEKKPREFLATLCLRMHLATQAVPLCVPPKILWCWAHVLQWDLASLIMSARPAASSKPLAVWYFGVL